MKIIDIQINNYKSIRKIHFQDIDNTLILVGKNNVGKSSILNGIKLFCGAYEVKASDFYTKNEPIIIQAVVRLYEADLKFLYFNRKVSDLRKYEKWLEQFKERIPSYNGEHITIGLKVYPSLEYRYSDGINKDNPYIQDCLPQLEVVGVHREPELLNSKILNFHGFSDVEEAIKNTCIFDKSRPCNSCFDCIGVINRKKPVELTLNETMKLVNYQLFSANLKKYSDSINKYFKNNYGTHYEVNYKFNFDIEELLKVHTTIRNQRMHEELILEEATSSMRSLYILSLFQAYLEVEGALDSIIIFEQPELHLHPELQKVASEILYKLSKKNQVIFTTHSPHMLYNFSTKQIKQISVGKEEHDTILGNLIQIDQILDDLGYSANDLIQADFVFIVEGKDDRSRLPVILDKYYSEIRNSQGELNRIAIIPTNSCTNIKTYANLKFINRGYLKNNFLMIRDSDGQDREKLVQDLCHYYDRRITDDDAKIPRIKPENVLVLTYYSIENYFLNPKIMTQLGIIQTEESFYEILFDKYKQYLYKLKSSKNMYKKTGVLLTSVEDCKQYIETIKTYIRGHNLFDIYYGKYRSKEEQMNMIKKYIEIAPKEEFKDILDSIDRFIFFDNRQKG